MPPMHGHAHRARRHRRSRRLRAVTRGDTQPALNAGDDPPTDANHTLIVGRRDQSLGSQHPAAGRGRTARTFIEQLAVREIFLMNGT
jgi:hypothetical protein